MAFTAYASSIDPATIGVTPRNPLKRSLSRVLGNRSWEVAPACRHVHTFLEDHGLSPQSLYASDLVVEELVRNATLYAYDGVGAVRVDVEVGDQNIAFTFTDHGRPFDPTRRAKPQRAGPPPSLSDAPVGGLGLRLVRRAAESIYYRRLAGTNRTVVIVTR